jgi:FkbH-like protein
MITTSLADIETALASAESSGLPALDMVVLRNVVVEPIESYYRYLSLQAGFNASVRFGAFDQVYQEAVGGRPDLLGASTTCVSVFLTLDVLSWNLARNFTALDRPAIEQEVGRIDGAIRAILAGIRRQTAAMILWHGFDAPLFPAYGIADYQRPDGQSAVIDDLNARLRAALAETGSAYFVDINACRARIGASTFYDRRYWHIGRAPYSREALREIGDEGFKYVRALKGRQKKCLVLDCDEVLWGGIVGEDGLAGIRLGRTYPGSAFLELQQEAVNLYHRGVILALCSKNNEADVWEVFRNHPDMILKESHIAAWRINWLDKASNIREIAAELNIGLDSMVFADDNEAECELVRRLLPEVEVVHLDRARAVDHAFRLASGGWFDTLTMSDEDRRRGASYRAEAERRQAQRDAPDLEGYLRSLEMVVKIRPADAVSLPRAAQLTQKTNQFNLTTQRYGEEQMARFAADPACDVLTVRVSDRFGDAGLVGVAIVRYEERRAVLDTLLLSCRVLGRGVEDALLTSCLRRAQARGASSLTGLFRPTARNQVAAGFLAGQGFRQADDAGETWEFDLIGWSPAVPSHLKALDDVDGEPVPEEGSGA